MIRSYISSIIFSTVIVFGMGAAVPIAHGQDEFQFQKGDLISATEDPRVYLLSERDGEVFKRWIPSPEVFNAHTHFRWGNIMEVEPEVVGRLRSGVPVEENEGLFPFGALSSTIENPKEFIPEDIGEYARLSRSVPVYSSLENAAARNHFTTFGGEATWVNVIRSAEHGGQQYSFIRISGNRTGWVLSSALGESAPLSELRGVELDRYKGDRLAMVYVNILNVRSAPGVMTAEARVGQIHQYDLVIIQEERVVGGVPWYRTGEGTWIHGAYVRNFTPSSRPERVGVNEKWMEINIKEQTIIAHEGNTPVYATLVSTGRIDHETIKGLFRPQSSHRTTSVSGANFDLPYVLVDAPWWVYFSGNYGWHGAYWHNNFGTVQSAGCVNLSPYDSNWFFQWADHPQAGMQGTWVYVH